MEGYSVTISNTSKELTPKQRVMVKDTSDAIKLDDATKENDVIIDIDYYVVLDVHNEKSDNKDYKNYILVDKSGEKYVTGSESFFTSFMDIYAEMITSDEEWQIKAHRLPSKNYTGKEFLTCSLI